MNSNSSSINYPTNYPVMVNGELHASSAVMPSVIAHSDRGLMYGDGVFETLNFRAGAPLQCALLRYHFRRLQRGLNALKISADVAQLERHLARYIEQLDKADACTVKITVTRGVSARGYAIDPQAPATMVISASPAVPVARSCYEEGVVVRLCDTRMGRNPALAGIKHLNRLEQVLARAEWDDDGIFEGFLCDSEGLLVEATAANVFLVKNAEVFTPDLTQCGVAGTQRDLLLAEVLPALHLSCTIRGLTLHDLYQADEVFLASSRIGVLPVRQCMAQRWSVGAITGKIMQALTA